MRDGDEFPDDRFTIPRSGDAILARAQLELPHAGSLDAELLPVERDLDVRGVDLDDERPLAGEHADHRGREVGHPRRLGDPHAGENRDEHEARDEPARPGPRITTRLVLLDPNGVGQW